LHSAQISDAAGTDCQIGWLHNGRLKASDGAPRDLKGSLITLTWQIIDCIELRAQI